MQRRTAALDAAAGASRSRETSTTRAVCALRSESLSPAELMPVDGSGALQHRVPPQASRETSTPRVVCALQSISPAELVEGSDARQHRVPPPARTTARDDMPRAVSARQTLSPAALGEGCAARQHQMLPLARRNRARRARHLPSADSTLCSPVELADDSAAPQHRLPPRASRDRSRRARHVSSALCSRSSQLSWRRAAPQGSIRCRRRCVVIAQDEPDTCRQRSADASPSRAGAGQRRTAPERRDRAR